jgi:hypothetical protein
MKILGQLTLDPTIEWQPHQLLSTIETIDNLYPEEGMPGHIQTTTQPEQDNLKDIGLTTAHSE